MKDSKVLLFLSLLFLGFSGVSCKKEIPGCKDEEADNYLYGATEDDGSCTYSGQLSFWYDNETRDSLVANDAENVFPFVNDSVSTNIYPDFVLWSAQPDCKTNSVGRLQVSLGHEKSKMINF